MGYPWAIFIHLPWPHATRAPQPLDAPGPRAPTQSPKRSNTARVSDGITTLRRVAHGAGVGIDGVGNWGLQEWKFMEY